MLTKVQHLLRSPEINASLAFCIALALLAYQPLAAVWFVPAFTLAFILRTRQAALGLLLGTCLGSFAISGQALFSGIQVALQTYIFGALDGAWHISAILFTLILGAFAGVLQANGGFAALAKKLLGHEHSQRRVESATAGLGLLCFFDGLANSMLVGNLARPLFDTAQVPRARLAYFVDSTSSAVACLSFISTWIAMQLSLIQTVVDDRALNTSSYSLFFSSIPYNFYCWFTLATVALVIWKRWDIGPMGREIPSTELRDNADTPSDGRVNQALIPLTVLILGIVCCFYFWDNSTPWPLTREKLVQSFGGSAGPYALLLGSLVGLATAYAMVPKPRRSKAVDAAKFGASSMLSPLLILVTAWSFGGMLKDLGTATWLSDHIVHLLPKAIYPLAVFLCGSLISISTGSSWGTMGLLMPIALNTWLDLDPNGAGQLPLVIAAVFSGAVFGDHCSPFSDTTIVSSFASGVSTDTHVKTQIPYAMITAMVAAICGFALAALGLPPSLSFALGLMSLFGIYCVWNAKNRLPLS